MYQKLMIYPFSSEVMPIVRYSSLTEFQISAVVSPKSWGYAGKDVGFCDGGPNIGLLVADAFQESLSLCDMVFMYLDSKQIKPETYCDYIHMCIDSGKEVIVTRSLMDYLTGRLSGTEKLKIIGNFDVTKPASHRLYPINVPTIVVAGLGEGCNKFDIQLALRKYFSQKCDKILQFGTKDYSELFGFLPLPNTLYNSCDFSQKILTLNHYIYNEINRENPDLLIIGVPGGFTYMTPEDPRYFGELAQCIFNATTPDFCIFSVYNENYTKEQLKAIEAKASGKLGCPIDIVHMSNQRLHLDSAALDDKVSQVTIGMQHFSARAGTFNVFDEKQCTAEFDRIYQMLTDATDVV